MGMAPTHEQISAMSNDELVVHYNELAKNTVVGTSFYREEIAHRQLARENARMLSLTRTMALLTWVILALTMANLALVLFPMLKSFAPLTGTG